MKHAWSVAFLVLLLSLTSATAHAQTPLWSGIISSSRAIDWTQAGAVPGSPGAVPDAGWTQCGSTLTATTYGGSSGGPASTSPINTIISACPAQTYIQLGAGTFYLAGAIAMKNQTVLRGMGANQTFLVFSTSS